jgi:subtilase family serine protease
LRLFSRLISLCVVAALATNVLAGCSGSSHASPIPEVAPAANQRSQPTTTSAQSLTPQISIPRLSGALAFTDEGRRSPNASVNVVFTLRYNHQSELDQFVADASNPHSASYGHFLSPAEFNAYYAPTAQQEEAVVSALGAAGFAVTKRFSNRTVIDASAPSSTVERFFSTEMHTVRQGKYGERFTNLTAATVPSAIASLVNTASLSNVVVVRTVVDQTADAGTRKPDQTCIFGICFGPSPTPTPSPTPKPTATPTAKPTATPTAAPTATAKPTATPTAAPTATPSAAPTATAKPTATPTATAAPTSTPGAGCNGAPPDNGPYTYSSDGSLAAGVAQPFDFPVQHGCNGAGYTAAIVIDDAVNTSYVATYLAAAGVKQTGTITNEAVDGGGTGDDAETDLDVQTISGLAPGANIIVYDNGSLADQNIEDAYNQVLTDGKASAVNSSFGGCESSDSSFESATNAIAEQGAAEGVEFSASSGDSGSNECSLYGGYVAEKGVSAPAGGPYFTSIGGVNYTYSSTGVLTSVTAGDASCGNTSGTCQGGGGVSTVVAEPSWQQGVPGMITSGRNQPDISLPFDPVAVYTGGAWAGYLGTSWSSPASVALFIEADELHGKRLGWLNPTLYSLFTSTGYGTGSYFTPCTSGSIGAYSCSATEYNQAAGIGTPKGWALANAL